MVPLSARSPPRYFNLPPFLLLIFFILFTSNFLLSPSNATTASPRPLHDLTSSDGFSNGDRRWIAEVAGGNSSFVLAARRTYRRDPLDSFKRYSGGWNISNEHYWASVGFTAVPFFAIAAAWFVIFGLTLLCTCLCFCCCRRAPYGYSRTCYACSLIFLILFTVAAIIGSFALYIGQGKFNSSTKNTLNYVVAQADATGRNLSDISSYLGAAKNIGVDQLTLPEKFVTQITDIQRRIDVVGKLLTSKTHENSRNIHRVLDNVGMALVIIAAFMLFLAFIGFLLSICGMQCLVYTLVVVGWILVTGTFILCGVSLLIHNGVADTCVAMDEWVQHPTAHTALDDILPCVDNATAQDILRQSKDINRQLVTLIDTAITNVTNGNYPPAAAPLYYNQSGPNLPLLCNPYNGDLTDRTCASGEVNYSSAAEVWKKYVCQVSTDNRICTTTGRLNPGYYEQLTNAAKVSYGLNLYGPFLVDMTDCTFVRRTFSDISRTYCPGLRRYTRWIYVGLLMVSASVMFSLIFWVVYARERRHRVYTKEMIGSGPN